MEYTYPRLSQNINEAKSKLNGKKRKREGRNTEYREGEWESMQNR